MGTVQLRTRHLLISGDIANDVFGDATQVYTVYYPQQHSLLLAPMDDEIFTSVHKARLQMLKSRNLSGDKSISLQEIIIDHEIDDTDRDLVYLHQPGMRILKITL